MLLGNYCPVDMFKKTGGRVEFKSESDLENFIIIHLEELLGLRAIAKQYRVNGEICDVLAVDSNQNLSIIELKNAEDRYVVQQLTRYYHNLKVVKPEIEGNRHYYSKPIQLIAIAPSFHKHNFIDKQYNQLKIYFWQFTIEQDKLNNTTCLDLTQVESQERKRIHINVTGVKSTSQKKTEATSVDRTDIIDYYTRLNHASKLEINMLTSNELKQKSERYKYTCSKEFRIKLGFRVKGERKHKIVTVKLPSIIAVWQFVEWAYANVPKVIAAGGSKRFYAYYNNNNSDYYNF